MTPPQAPFTTIAEGVELAVLRKHDDRGMTFLIRMAKGARAPRHDHPGGEETYMLSGRVRIAQRIDAAGVAQPDVVLTPNDYLHAAPGEVHEGVAEEDALFFVVAPGGVVRI